MATLLYILTTRTCEGIRRYPPEFPDCRLNISVVFVIVHANEQCIPLPLETATPEQWSVSPETYGANYSGLQPTVISMMLYYLNLS